MLVRAQGANVSSVFFKASLTPNGCASLIDAPISSFILLPSGVFQPLTLEQRQVFKCFAFSVCVVAIVIFDAVDYRFFFSSITFQTRLSSFNLSPGKSAAFLLWQFKQTMTTRIKTKRKTSYRPLGHRDKLEAQRRHLVLDAVRSFQDERRKDIQKFLPAGQNNIQNQSLCFAQFGVYTSHKLLTYNAKS